MLWHQESYLNDIINGTVRLFDGTYHHFVIAGRKFRVFKSESGKEENFTFDNIEKAEKTIFATFAGEQIAIPINVSDKKMHL